MPSFDTEKFFEHFMAAIAATSAFTTLLTFAFNWNNEKITLLGSFLIIGFIIILCILYAFFQSRIKKNISLKINDQLKVNIFEGDLLEVSEKEKLVVINVNEYFDTKVDEKIITKNSIHGKYIEKYWKDRIDELDEKIEKNLPEDTGVKSENRTDGKKFKYPLGTCVNIRDCKNLYVLTAFTHFDDNNKANLNNDELKQFLCNLFQHLKNNANGRPVYMPLMGTGQSGLKKSPQRLLLLYLDFLEFFCPVAIPGGVNIVINSLKGTNINLNDIEKAFNKNIKQ